MCVPSLPNAALPCLASVQLAYWVAWGGSLVLSIALVVLMWTRWGHSKPLQKCAALSLLVHLMLAFLTMTVRIVAGDVGGGGGGMPIRVRIVQDRGTATLTNIATETNARRDVAPPQLFAPPPTKEEVPTFVEDTPPKPADVVSEVAAKRSAEAVKKIAEAHDALMAPALLAVPHPEKTAPHGKTPDKTTASAVKPPE